MTGNPFSKEIVLVILTFNPLRPLWFIGEEVVYRFIAAWARGIAVFVEQDNSALLSGG